MFCLWWICTIFRILFNSIWNPWTCINLTYCFLGSILCSWPTNFNGWTIAVIHRSSTCRKRVRFDQAAEFLAACASEDTEEATLMLQEAKETKRRNGEDVGEIINCSNADGITALHQVRPVPPLPLRFNWNYGLMQRWLWNESLSCTKVSRCSSVSPILELTILKGIPSSGVRLLLFFLDAGDERNRKT